MASNTGKKAKGLGVQAREVRDFRVTRDQIDYIGKIQTLMNALQVLQADYAAIIIEMQYNWGAEKQLGFDFNMKDCIITAYDLGDAKEPSTSELVD